MGNDQHPSEITLLSSWISSWALKMLFVTLVAGCTACSTTRTYLIDPPGRGDAIEILSSAVSRASNGDAVGLCGLAASGAARCEESLLRAPPPPARDPTVDCTVDVPASSSHVGSTILVVSGRHDDGSRYQSEILAFLNEDGDLRLSNPVYWYESRVTIGAGSSVSTSAGEPDFCLMSTPAAPSR